MSIATTDTADVLAAHEAWLRRVVRRHMADPALVDDALQETLLRVCRSSPPDDPAQLRPWLATVAKRACADVWRAHQRRVAPLDGGADRLPAGNAVVPGSDEHLGAVATRTRINRALGQLPPRHRRLLEKQALFGLTYEEIAHEEDVSVACVTSALGRARAGFRRGFAAPAVVLVDRVRARVHAVLSGYGMELAAASVTLGMAAVVLVPSAGATMPPERVPTAPAASRAVAAASPAPNGPSGTAATPAPAVRPGAAAAAVTAPATVPAPTDSRNVGDVTVQSPRIELRPEQWTIRYGVEVRSPTGPGHVRGGVELYCTKGTVTAQVCALAPQQP